MGSALLAILSVVIATVISAHNANARSSGHTAGGVPQQVAPESSSPRTKKRSPRKAYERYQVPAGTFLSIELRTRLSSETNQPADQVDGRLLQAINADGVELVPAGAAVLGTITEAESAGVKKPARLALSFHIIEHPDTGSRATIKTTVLEFQSERPAKGKVFSDVRLEKGTDASVSLLAPLSVLIPVAAAGQK